MSCNIHIHSVAYSGILTGSYGAHSHGYYCADLHSSKSLNQMIIVFNILTLS